MHRWTRGYNSLRVYDYLHQARRPVQSNRNHRLGMFKMKSICASRRAFKISSAKYSRATGAGLLLITLRSVCLAGPRRPGGVWASAAHALDASAFAHVCRPGAASAACLLVALAGNVPPSLAVVTPPCFSILTKGLTVEDLTAELHSLRGQLPSSFQAWDLTEDGAVSSLAWLLRRL